MSDVHPFDATRHRGEIEDLFQSEQSLAWIDLEDFGLRMLLQITAKVQVLEGLDLISQTSRLFKFQFFSRQSHFFFQFAKQTLLLPFQEQPKLANVAAVVVAGDP